MTADPNGNGEQVWSHEDIWKRCGDGFCVEISRHSEPLSDISPELGPHRWCVYAYIYPQHPHFARFDKTDSFFHETCAVLPLHGGASYLRTHYLGDGAKSCVQVGADYNHLHDEHFTHLTPEQAGEVFKDAENLFRWLTEKGKSVL